MCRASPAEGGRTERQLPERAEPNGSGHAAGLDTDDTIEQAIDTTIDRRRTIDGQRLRRQSVGDEHGLRRHRRRSRDESRHGSLISRLGRGRYDTERYRATGRCHRYHARLAIVLGGRVAVHRAMRYGGLGIFGGQRRMIGQAAIRQTERAAGVQTEEYQHECR